MTFNPAIPQPTDNLDDSQGDLLANNQALDASFTKDHTLFSDSTVNNGYHKQTTLYQVRTDPSQTFPYSMVYSKNVGSTPNRVTNLYFSSKPETGVDVVQQLTGSIIIESGNDGFAGTYNVFKTPWNFRIFTGQTASFSGSRNFTLSGAQTFGSTIYTSLVSPFGGGAVATSFSPNASTNQFNINTAANIPVRWLAITN